MTKSEIFKVMFVTVSSWIL